MGSTKTLLARLATLVLALFVCARGAAENAERDVPPVLPAPELVRNSSRLGHPAVNVADPALRAAWITAVQMRADERFGFTRNDSVVTAHNGAQGSE